MFSELWTVAEALRKDGYEARNLGEVGITVWKYGRGLYLPVEEIRHLSGNLSQQIELLLRAELAEHAPASVQ